MLCCTQPSCTSCSRIRCAVDRGSPVELAMSCRLRQQCELSNVSRIAVMRETIDDVGFHSSSSGGGIFASLVPRYISGGVTPGKERAPPECCLLTVIWVI